jgi:MFS family permease
MTSATAMVSPGDQSPGNGALLMALLPMIAVVFVTFGVIGLAMPVLPLHVHQRLGMSAFVVGLVGGSQFAASLVSRLLAGNFADTRGGKLAMFVGLAVAASAGGLYLLSLRFLSTPAVSAGVLILGRGVLGGAESFVITGALGWGLAIGGPERSGKVIAWMGTPMFAAFAMGAPVGSWIYAQHGFVGIAVATIIAPLLSMSFISRATPVQPKAQQRPPLGSVIQAVRLPGLGFALGGMGFGSVTIFITLLFVQRGWNGSWGGLTCFSIAFVLARVLFGGLPDRLGGAKVAVVSILIETAGQAMIWLAPVSAVAFLGTAFTGFGHSLLYPSLGLEAVRRARPESRALVMGTYTACSDLAMALAGVILGAVAGHYGTDKAFLASTLLVGSSIVFAIALQRAGDRDASTSR